MKTIEQLLELTKNPYYKFTQAEQAVLDDFLAKKADTDSAKSHTTSSTKLSKETPVRVRNIVEKTIPQPEDAPEPSESTQDAS